jgi:transposase
MWAPYIAFTRERVPHADQLIVFDKFHVISNLTDAVDKVRRKEHAQLRRQGDQQLTGIKYTWLKGKAHRSDQDERTIRKAVRAGLEVGMGSQGSGVETVGVPIAYIGWEVLPTLVSLGNWQ